MGDVRRLEHAEKVMDALYHDLDNAVYAIWECEAEHHRPSTELEYQEYKRVWRIGRVATLPASAPSKCHICGYDQSIDPKMQVHCKFCEPRTSSAHSKVVFDKLVFDYFVDTVLLGGDVLNESEMLEEWNKLETEQRNVYRKLIQVVLDALTKQKVNIHVI